MNIKLKKQFRWFCLILSAGMLLQLFNNCSKINVAEKDVVESNSKNGEFVPQENLYHIKKTYDVLQSAPKDVDILFIVDTSTSMGDYQEKVGAGFSKFITALTQLNSSINWRIAVTTANIQPVVDPSNIPPARRGELLSFDGLPENTFFIDKNTSNYVDAFKNTILLPTSATENIVGNTPDDDERGIYNANLVIDRRTELGHGFFRNNSELHMIMVSDENEKSDGLDLDSYDLPETLIKNVNDKLNVAKFRFHSVIAGLKNSNCKDVGKSSVYETLSDLTLGLKESICDNDFSQILEKLGANISEPNTSLPLMCDPIAEVSVQISPKPVVEPKYSISGFRINFDRPFEPNSTVVLEYDCL